MEQIANLHIEKLPEGLYLATSDKAYPDTHKKKLKHIKIQQYSYL